MAVLCADVIRGTSTPLIVLFTSSIALGSGCDASLLIATFWALLLTGKMVEDNMKENRMATTLMLHTVGRGGIAFTKSI